MNDDTAQNYDNEALERNGAFVHSCSWTCEHQQLTIKAHAECPAHSFQRQFPRRSMQAMLGVYPCGGCNACTTGQGFIFHATLVGSDGQVPTGQRPHKVYVGAAGLEHTVVADVPALAYNIQRFRSSSSSNCTTCGEPVSRKQPKGVSRGLSVGG